jgi:hypothetical protein
VFEEFSKEKFPFQARSEALAFVRDGQVWSQLVPSKDPATGRFRIFKINFKEALDNSGFIGWLATHLKLKIGTGVFVICGQNDCHGGIFDYWGFPIEVGELVKAEINKLIDEYHRNINNRK